MPSKAEIEAAARILWEVQNLGLGRPPKPDDPMWAVVRKEATAALKAAERVRDAPTAKTPGALRRDAATMRELYDDENERPR